MSFLVRHRLLTVLTVLALFLGLGHQVFGAYSRHHHCACTEQTDGGDEPQDSHSSDGDCNHAICHHGLVAIAEKPAAINLDRRCLLELVALRVTNPPEVEPAPIDHPPQLG